jgi:hypothetical protein
VNVARYLLTRIEGPPSVLEFAEQVRFEPDPWEDWQRDFLINNDDQVALNCHRGAGKTAVVSVKALHQIVTVPNFEVLALSRSDEAAMQLTGYVQKRLGMLRDHPRVVEDNKHKLVLENGSSITSIPCGDNSPRSYHVNLMVEDEAAFVPQAVYMAARPTVRAKRGRYLILSTPKGKVGHFYDICENQPGWTKFKVTWRDTKRFTPDDIAKIERERIEMGEAWFSQEYEGAFVQTSGQIISEESIVAAQTDGIVQDDLSDVVW